MEIYNLKCKKQELKPMKKFLLAPLIALLPGLASADTILGLYAGARVWQVDFSGEVGERDDTVSLEDLGYKQESSNVLWLRFEHFVPLIPNIALMYSSIDASASSSVSRDFSVGGVAFELSDDVDSQIDLTHIDTTFYYEILDNWVSLDLGLTARKFDGYLEATTESQGTSTGELKGVLPLLYGRAQFDLPLSGLSVGAQINTISYSDNGITDFEAYLGYELSLVAVDVGMNIGYRTLTLKVDDFDELYADAEISGAFAELKIHF